MSKQKAIWIIGGVFLIAQVIFFRGHIFPFSSAQLQVKGLACTCPDETVVSGEDYLRTITPDSLKKYDLDYSEMYVTTRPFGPLDPMGVGLYSITGRVIGKERVSEYDPWVPKFQVDEWKAVNPIIDGIVKGMFLLQMMWLLVFWKANKGV